MRLQPESTFSRNLPVGEDRLKQTNGNSFEGSSPKRAHFTVAVLTGGDDKSYVLGLVSALISQEVPLDVIGSDNVDAPIFHKTPDVAFLNLRGDQRENASLKEKVLRIFVYYARLIRYAAISKARVFHILWNNKFEFFDRTFLMMYYRLCGKKIVLTAHNVNAAKRDSRDTSLNRFSLTMQYRLADHIFVHTKKMKDELEREFGVQDRKVSVIPFGINNTLPNTSVTRTTARKRLGFDLHEKTILFFGQIAPYKGLEFLVEALSQLLADGGEFRLFIAGKIKRGHESYWSEIASLIAKQRIDRFVTASIRHIPDEEVEIFFKAADVLAIPYTSIFQSGVPFLSYSFGLPVIATDVGSLREDVIDGKTGFLCKPSDSKALAESIEMYFASDLFRNLESRREDIRQFANERYSWDKVATITTQAYSALLSS